MCSNVEIFFRNHNWGALVSILGGEELGCCITVGNKNRKIVTIKLTKKRQE